jgi:hypothetical protein
MPIIYYRKSLMDKQELEIANNFFTTTDLISRIKTQELVIGRFSLWPFYVDQQRELELLGCKLINSYNEHLYVADLQNYIYDLKELTPRTWSNLQNLPDNMKFVLKGETNSRKGQWKTDMFAEDKKQAINVYFRLLDDSLIGQQKIYIREYIPLNKLLDGVNGMPVTKEFRFFVAYGQILCGAFYWQNYVDDLQFIPDINEVPASFLQKVIDKIDNQCNFYTIDVAQAQSGEWIVIELNDGQFSGLSCNSPIDLYKNLARVISSNNELL